jgi:NAD-dependent deacetylase
MDRIQAEIAKCTLMLVIGTSGSVYPAAGFVNWARQQGSRTVYIGPEPPLNSSSFTQVVQGKLAKSCPASSKSSSRASSNSLPDLPQSACHSERAQRVESLP